MSSTITESFLSLWVSGQNHRLTSIELYPEAQVLEWRRLINEGAQQLGPVTTGIGVIGSAGWVIAGSLALRAVEGILTSAAQKEGLKLLVRAEVALEQLRSARRLIPVPLIDGLSQPNPTAWVGMVVDEEPVDMRTLTHVQFAAMSKHRSGSTGDTAHSEPPTRMVEKRFRSLADEFVTGLDQDHGMLTIRWSSVDAFRFVPGGRSTESAEVKLAR